MQIRPYSAIESQDPSRIHSNQQFGYFYMLSKQGKEIKVNKQGDIVPKFVDNFTGFVNFKERKNESLKNKNLMYSQPNLKYKKEENPIHPKGSKLLGYAQYPYDLKGNLPDFLEEETFKSSSITRNLSCQLKKATLSNANIRYSQNVEKNSKDCERNERKFKTFMNKCESFVSFDGLNENCRYGSFRCEKINLTKEDKNERSLIMDASAKYHNMQRLKTANCKSSSSFCSTNVSEDRFMSRSNKNNNEPSFFSQSLFNIERTETPNYIYETSPEQTFNSFNSDSTACPFSQTSTKLKCYKSSCHNMEYIPKRRYKKKQYENNTVCITDYAGGLELEKKESQIVLKLKDSLKIYQPVPKEAPTNLENIKKSTKDKLKQNSSQGLKK